jgi:hypothetical protein
LLRSRLKAIALARKGFNANTREIFATIEAYNRKRVEDVTEKPCTEMIAYAYGCIFVWLSCMDKNDIMIIMQTHVVRIRTQALKFITKQPNARLNLFRCQFIHVDASVHVQYEGACACAYTYVRMHSPGRPARCAH